MNRLDSGAYEPGKVPPLDLLNGRSQCNAAFLKQHGWLLETQWQSLCAASRQTFEITAEHMGKKHNATSFVTACRLMELLDYLEHRTVLLHGASTSLLAAVILRASFFILFACFPDTVASIETTMQHLVGFIQRCEPVIFAQNSSFLRPVWWIDIHRARFYMVKLCLELFVSQSLNIFSDTERQNGITEPHGKTTESLTHMQSRLVGSCPNDLVQALSSSPPEFCVEPMTASQRSMLSSVLDRRGIYVAHGSIAFQLNTNVSRLPQWAESSLLVAASHPVSDARVQQESFKSLDESRSELPTSINKEDAAVADIVQLFHIEPIAAIDNLIQLPPSMANMDFLSRALANATVRSLFELYDHSANDVVRRFLQRNLRQLENKSLADEHLMDSNHRASLLVVFLRNVLSRGLIDPEPIYLDIQELCTRYIWIPAVLEFRRWLFTATTLQFEQREGGALTAGEASWPSLGG